MKNRTTPPHGWSSSAIGDVCNFRRGVSWKKSQERRSPSSNTVPVLRIPNVQETLELEELLYIDGLTKAQQAKARVKEGWTLLVGSNGNPRRVGNCVYVAEPRDFLFASFLIGAEPINPDRLDSEFLYRLLNSRPVQSDIWQSVQGSTGLCNIDLNMLKSLNVPIPPVPEQRKIAAILSSVDDAIEKTQAVIDQVQVVKRGLMQELLTRGLPGRHTRFKQTEIGEIPEEWGVERLGTLVQDGTSVTYGIVQAGPHIEHGVPYIKTGDMTSEGIRLDGLARTDPNIAAKYRRSEVRSGDLVFAIRASVGMVAEVPPQLDGANLTQGTARISPSERVTSRYLLWVLRGAAIQKWVALRTKGTTYREITLKTLKDVPTPVPTIDEQHALTRILDSLAARESSEKRRGEQLYGLKSALMSVLLTGELPVTPTTEVA